MCEEEKGDPWEGAGKMSEDSEAGVKKKKVEETTLRKSEGASWASTGQRRVQR